MFCLLRPKVKLSHADTDDAAVQGQQQTNVDGANTSVHGIPNVGSQNSDVTQIPAVIQRAKDFQARYEQLGQVDDLNGAIASYREALSLYPPAHPDRLEPTHALAGHLVYLFKHLGRIDDLNEAIVLFREVLSICPPNYYRFSVFLNNFAQSLFSRYERLGGVNGLEEAIALCQEALQLCPPGHPRRTESLIYLAHLLYSRYDQLGGLDDLNESITLYREALSLCPPEHPERSMYMNNFAIGLFCRYRKLEEVDDLDEAITFARELLMLHPPGHPHRSMSLYHLATRLFARYDRFGEIDDENEAIVLWRAAASLFPPGHEDRKVVLADFATRLFSCHEKYGRIDDLNEAILLGREVLSLCPPGNPHRATILANFGNLLSSRYKQLGGIDDIEEAIVLGREALSLRPSGHPDRFNCLNNLSISLSARYERLREINDLNEAITLCKDALLLSPPGHPNHPKSLLNFSQLLCSRYNKFRSIYDLNVAIVFDRGALLLYPHGHPDRSKALNNLANHLMFRHMLLNGIDDLDEAISLDQEALLLHPPGHLWRSLSLKNLAGRLLNRHIHFRMDGDSRAALEYKQVSFDLYAQLKHVSQTVSTNDLLASREWVDRAEEYHHPATLSAYETALRLLVEHSVSLPSLPQHLTLLKSLSPSLAVDAFSACLRNRSPAKAVELLEQGRGIFWSQLTRLRSPIDDVASSGPRGKELADEFTRLTSIIHMVLRSTGPDQHDRILGLNIQLKKVVSDIRDLPGLSRFLLPPLFSDLQRAARDGPVIIVNASKYGCDALVVFDNKDPVHIPLPVTREDVRGLASNLHTLRNLAIQGSMDVTTGFRSFLRELWDRVACHIVDVLREICPRQSRIWWCPTAEFSPLPLHAAMPYRTDQESVSGLFISSYTTTLTALLRARQPPILNPKLGKKRFVAIGQAKAPGFPELHSIQKELANIKRHVRAVSTFTSIEGKHAHIPNAADELGKNEWAHFACHGLADQERPFESAFALRDGLFTIQRIIQCNLENPEFAYLSACQTTVGDEENPDEVIHLASAMQFAGFRSVVGTMWSVADYPAAKVASTFYKLMAEEAGCLDHTRAAWALWKTLNTVDIPLDQRILYVHLGA